MRSTRAGAAVSQYLCARQRVLRVLLGPLENPKTKIIGRAKRRNDMSKIIILDDYFIKSEGCTFGQLRMFRAFGRPKARNW